MNRRLITRALSAILLTAALAFFLVPTQRAVFAQQSGSKDDLTPTFWQRDPDADFEDEGRMHGAPTAVSYGLIYLTKAYGMKRLVPGTGQRTRSALSSNSRRSLGQIRVLAALIRTKF